LKIADFGLSDEISQDDTGKICGKICGTPGYIAPEILKK
jgi:serine/threonine protein kinase